MPRQALADADHLAILHAIWAAETAPARDQAYRDLLMNSLPPGYHREPGHQAKWLWRTQPAEIDQWITDLAVGHRTFAAMLADRQSQAIPSEDPDYGDLGPAFPAWTGPGREPILQPPRPEIPPSPQILERAMDRDADWEAAD
jgi:hypothetical protein